MSRKIRIISSGYIVFSALLALFLVAHYGYFHLGHIWRDSTALAQLPPFPHPMIEIPRSSQIIIAILNMLPLVPSLCALYFGARVMADFRSGALFHRDCNPLNVPRRVERHCPCRVETSFPKPDDPLCFQPRSYGRHAYPNG